MKGKPMETKRNIMNSRGGSASRPSARRAALLFAALLAASTAPALAGNAGTGGALRDEYSPVEAPRPKRWWAEPCSHSMQEVAFIAWMDVAFNGTAWRWALPVWQVETFYAWWTVNVWPDLAGTR
jgi:hypothetical protein